MISKILKDLYVTLNLANLPNRTRRGQAISAHVAPVFRDMLAAHRTEMGTTKTTVVIAVKYPPTPPMTWSKLPNGYVPGVPQSGVRRATTLPLRRHPPRYPTQPCWSSSVPMPACDCRIHSGISFHHV
jgi:hypothetical protein